MVARQGMEKDNGGKAGILLYHHMYIPVINEACRRHDSACFSPGSRDAQSTACHAHMDAISSLAQTPLIHQS
jgi:hypothetical protein